MTKDTTKSPADSPQSPEPKKSAASSVISKLGRWFSSKKNKDAAEPSATESPTREGSEAQSENSDRSSRPRRPRPRGGRRRSRPKSSDQKTQTGQAEAAKVEKTAGDQPADVEAKTEPARRPRKRRPPRQDSEKTTKPASARGPAKDKIDEEEETAAVDDNIKCTLLINSEEPEECRIALLEKGRVESFHVDTVVHTRTKGNIYKGRIVGVEPNLQAAFIEIGEDKNGFVPFSDIHPEYYSRDIDPSTHWKDISIENVIKKGQELLVQVAKEAVGNKGANMTTFISLPGRYLVLMPGSDSAGISKKIESESQRAKLRKMIESLDIPEGIGYIIRTASSDITKTALAEDMKFLLNLWNEIKTSGQKMKSPALIYKDQDIIGRFLRDHFNQSIKEIIVDTQESLDQVKNFLELIPARHKKPTVRLHKGSRPLFDQYQVERQIEQIYQPIVKLPSGGSIVISPTEALVAIDVNSGRTSKDKNFEETIFLANMEAAEEMARQLRLRDLGGLIVVDFIDMRESKHIREVEKMVKNSMKSDKAKVDISRISKFGLMQISRQKMASPVQAGSYIICEHCQGRGLLPSVETQALTCLRRIQTGVIQRRVQRVECRLPVDVAQYLTDKKGAELAEIEEKYHVVIAIEPDPAKHQADLEINFVKA